MIYTIIGAGWLGTPLALHLKQQGHTLKTSTRDADKRDRLVQQGMQCECLNLTSKTDYGSAQIRNLLQSDVLLITLPPGIRHGRGDEYLAVVKALVAAADLYSIGRVVITSSSSVYADKPCLMHEKDASAYNSKASLLLAAENAVANRQGDYLICRLTGLFGGGRDPARFAKRMSSINQNAMANMLHQQEAVAALAFLLEKEVKNQVVNISSQQAVKKAEFYQAAVANSNEKIVMPPLTDGPAGKVIATARLEALGYQFLYKTAIHALTAK